MKGPETIEELVERLAERAKHLPQEQAQVVASCLERALRGAQDEHLYEIVDSIFDHFNQPKTPVLQVGTVNGDLNAFENKNHDHPNQQSQRKLQSLHE